MASKKKQQVATSPVPSMQAAVATMAEEAPAESRQFSSSQPKWSPTQFIETLGKIKEELPAAVSNFKIVKKIVGLEMDGKDEMAFRQMIQLAGAVATKASQKADAEDPSKVYLDARKVQAALTACERANSNLARTFDRYIGNWRKRADTMMSNARRKDPDVIERESDTIADNMEALDEALEGKKPRQEVLEIYNRTFTHLRELSKEATALATEASRREQIETIGSLGDDILDSLAELDSI
jgi:hypothetical protein